MTFTRSALKPLQALPFVAAGGVERFGFTPPQVALLCASHSGEPRHVEAAAVMLAKAGNAPTDLQCGTHAPRFYEVRGELPPPPPYSPLAHNCSGKHAGCSRNAWRCGYAQARLPGTAIIRCSSADPRAPSRDFTGVPDAERCPGIDGCSAPNYAVPLAALALGFARLAATRSTSGYGARAASCWRDAMIAHPEMVSGEGRSDLALTRAGRGDWVCKIGAEGVQAIGIRSRGSGIAIKVADGSTPGAAAGDDRRAGPARPARRRGQRSAGRHGRASSAQLSRDGHRRDRGPSLSWTNRPHGGSSVRRPAKAPAQ